MISLMFIRGNMLQFELCIMNNVLSKGHNLLLTKIYFDRETYFLAIICLSITEIMTIVFEVLSWTCQ